MPNLILILAVPLALLTGYAQAQPGAPSSYSSTLDASSMGSTYVPIESWVYPAIERLAVAGYIDTAFAGLRPWTRMECARLIAEAQEERDDLDTAEQAGEQEAALLRALDREFALELRQQDGLVRDRLGAIESIDLSSVTITGGPLTDAYHNAETITNNYGRPYGQGENVYAGIALRASSGHFAGFIRAELQQTAPSSLAPLSANAAIAAADFTPAAALGPASGFTRGRLLEAYASYAFKGSQLSFGKQALWWGPGRGGPLLFSDNAEPFTMLRYDRVSPFELPGIGRWLGPIRVQAFIGRLSGQQFVHVGSETLGHPDLALNDQPFIHGQKISFKPTANFEFSVSRTVIFAGAGAPFTTASLFRSLFSYGNTAGKNDPGDRRSAVDMQYRFPKLRNWLTVYVDTFTDDEPFPLNYPTDSAWSPGIYLARVPHLPKMDFRAEGFLTPQRDLFPGFYYFNVHYLSGYTNQRELMGSWIGRDISVSADLALKPDWQLRIAAQQERWRFPLFAVSTTNNFTTTIQLSYRPKAKEL